MRTGKVFSARRGLLVGALVPAVAVLALAVTPSSGASPQTVLVGGVPALGAGVHATGPLPAQRRLTLTVVLRPRDEAALHSFAVAVSTPQSPLYRHYVGIRAFAARFGAAPSSLALVRRTLRRDGLHVGAVARDGLSLNVSGSAAQVSHTFGVRLRDYREASGRQVYANVSSPRLPAALGSAVTGVLGLDDLDSVAPAEISAAPQRSPAAAPRARSAAAGGGPVACANATSIAQATHAYTIDQVDHAYGIDGLLAQGDTGAGVTVALVEAEGYPTVNTDIGTFDQCYFRTTGASVSTVSVDGGPLPGGVEGLGLGKGEGEETSVDIQNTLGVAPSASIVVYQGPATEQGYYEMISDAIASGAQVIQDSWAECETTREQTQNWPTMENQELMAADGLGESFLTSSGDRGSEGCQTIDDPDEIWGDSTLATQLAVEDPAGQPFATAVGGTEMTSTGPAPTETVWNQFGWGAGGGGISNIWAMPAYQANYGVPGVINSYSSGVPCKLTSGYCREVPDVSASASTRDGYALYYDGGWTAVGGTSTSTPLWAGVVALADASSGLGCTLSAPLGFLNPDLYEVAAGPGGADAFNDITSGDNNPEDPAGAYPATPGYDMATGLGSPIATDGSKPGLVAQLCQAASLPASPTPTLTAMSSNEAGTGATVTLTGSGFTPFSRVLFGTVAAASVNFVSSTQLSVVVPAGTGVVAVAVTTIAGNTGSSPTAADTFTYAPTATITVPASGVAYTQQQAVAAAYSCASTATTCSGSVPNGALLDTSIPGTHQFAVTASDAKASTTATATYTVVPPPAVAISGPAPNATYTQGQVLTAQYSCLTSTPVTIASCSAPVSEGAVLDTETLGPHSFTVVATDSNGVTTRQTVSYVVVSAPRATISTPANGAVFVRGSAVNASYLCTAAAPARIVSCAANTFSGGKIDTSTVGVHDLTATAVDSNGVAASASVAYTVVAARPKISALRQASAHWATRRIKGARVPVGTTFSFSLDQAAKVTLRFARQGAGRMKAGRCVAPAKAPAGARACKLALGAGAITISVQHGANAVTFDGHTSAGSLSPGNYTVTLTAVGLAGKPSAPATLHFTVAAGG